MYKSIFSIFLILNTMWALSQITVTNAGFDDTPSDATVPQGWSACAWLTTSDILSGYYTGLYIINHIKVTPTP